MMQLMPQLKQLTTSTNLKQMMMLRLQQLLVFRTSKMLLFQVLMRLRRIANQAIEDALNTKVNEINNASNLNDAEKQKLVDQATEAATTAKNNS